ncbi:hypothetical protein [Pseudomonas syringae]|uniref:hypothetical protein n=1 Tax=Pseudomonas syringae TaxID=317 RepID=UPI000D863136|nr:hypothetical protein [Pseudomonas syringae]PYD29612.1 hypothetical protein DND67_15550 [Pseudomonas syringae pv. pisi]
MSFLPSCDAREDAARSLAEIYGVSIRDVERVLLSPEVTEIAQTYDEIGKQGFHFVVAHLLKASPRHEFTHACYYHSTSYDGDPSWFDDGLLGSSQGVEKFLDKIIRWIPDHQRQSVIGASRRLVRDRSQLEGSNAESCGPYAWNTLAAASSVSSGMRYRVPEAIQDLWTPSGIGRGGLIDLRPIINERLKPAVVKFKGKTLDLDDYCAVLWAYLLSDDGECHLTHTFLGGGVSIPPEDIIEIIDVNLGGSQDARS